MYRTFYNRFPPPCPPPPSLHPSPKKLPPSKFTPPSSPKKKKKFDFCCFRKDACKSLNDVEHFLCDFNSFIKYVKIYKLMKK